MRTKVNLDYIRAKMEEISDLVNSVLSQEYTEDARFSYNLSENDLEITLVLDDDHRVKDDKYGDFRLLEILFDFDALMIGTYIGQQENFRVNSIEEGMEIIEKKIYSVLGIAEKKEEELSSDDEEYDEDDRVNED